MRIILCRSNNQNASLRSASTKCETAEVNVDLFVVTAQGNTGKEEAVTSISIEIWSSRCGMNGNDNTNISSTTRRARKKNVLKYMAKV